MVEEGGGGEGRGRVLFLVVAEVGGGDVVQDEEARSGESPQMQYAILTS